MTFQLFVRRLFIGVSCLLFPVTVAFAADPIVTVISPLSGSNGGSPVHYVAAASSRTCAKGIAAMRIYIAPHVSAYTVESSKLDTVLALSPGIFNTVVQAWDNCGAVGKTSVNITVAAPGLRPARFLYVADDSRNRVWGFTVDPSTGALDPTGQGPIATNSSYRLASDKGGNRLYVTNAGPVPFARVYAYFVDRRNGSLHPVPTRLSRLARPQVQLRCILRASSSLSVPSRPAPRGNSCFQGEY